MAVPELPIFVQPPSAVYRTIRAATLGAVENKGAVTHAPPHKRPRWWARRPRPTLQVAFTEELYAAIVAVATQESLSLAAACRSLVTLGVKNYQHIIANRTAEIAAENLPVA